MGNTNTIIRVRGVMQVQRISSSTEDCALIFPLGSSEGIQNKVLSIDIDSIQQKTVVDHAYYIACIREVLQVFAC